MAYLKRRIVTGSVIEIEKWQTIGNHDGAAKPRAKKQKPTPDEMFKTNERNAAIKLRRKINTYFGPGDFHAVFDYHAQLRPTAKGSRVHQEKLVRALHSYFAAQNRALRYIAVTEHTRSNIHHHFILPACDPADLMRIWTEQDMSHWRVKIFPLDNTGQYKVLAEYLIKETSKTFRDGTGAYRKRWCESRGLTVKLPKPEIVKANQWRETPVPEKGCYIETDSVETGTNPFTGLVWQKYSMVKPPHLPSKPRKIMRC